MLQKLAPSIDGVSIIEVLASCALILVALVAIFGMNSESLQILRRTRQAATSSQILQERIEEMRMLAWPSISRASVVATWWNTPTDSAPDLADADPTETLTVSIPPTPSVPTPPNSSFQLQRSHGTTRVIQDADLSASRLVLVDLKISWREQRGTQTREVRTIIARDGLTTSGLFGSAFGRAATTLGGSPSS